MQVVYIAGPLRADTEDKEKENKAAFMNAEIKLFGAGYAPLNPVRFLDGIPDERCLPVCMAMLQAADVVVMLNGWPYSEGAKAEFYFALRQGKEVICTANKKAFRDKFGFLL